MNSRTTPEFWKLYEALPQQVQRTADKAYEIWQTNPNTRGLYFKRVGRKEPVYSVRVGRGHRVLGLLVGDTVLWFWIGKHDEYERILKHI